MVVVAPGDLHDIAHSHIVALISGHAIFIGLITANTIIEVHPEPIRIDPLNGAPSTNIWAMMDDYQITQ
ncbi:hypothetical protein SCLCIDRAFT_29415 [Scleroderma citrinum Foug A]|uniref:Uncharacterized protein n=1 Tax=Scleroderma citrinum Foug A TaxID=1036808 RepID=A0A0C3DK24_9AGAM|nr:hypothetical protein SCLCIDRAFT_29415 [Scleroderma citrinum Foug A]